MGDVSSLIIQSFIQHQLSVMEFSRQAFPSAPPVCKHKQYMVIRVSTHINCKRKYKITCTVPAQLCKYVITTGIWQSKSSRLICSLTDTSNVINCLPASTVLCVYISKPVRRLLHMAHFKLKLDILPKSRFSLDCWDGLYKKYTLQLNKKPQNTE